MPPKTASYRSGNGSACESRLLVVNDIENLKKELLALQKLSPSELEQEAKTLISDFKKHPPKIKDLLDLCSTEIVTNGFRPKDPIIYIIALLKLLLANPTLLKLVINSRDSTLKNALKDKKSENKITYKPNSNGKRYSQSSIENIRMFFSDSKYINDINNFFNECGDDQRLFIAKMHTAIAVRYLTENTFQSHLSRKWPFIGVYDYTFKPPSSHIRALLKDDKTRKIILNSRRLCEKLLNDDTHALLDSKEDGLHKALNKIISSGIFSFGGTNYTKLKTKQRLIALLIYGKNAFKSTKETIFEIDLKTLIKIIDNKNKTNHFDNFCYVLRGALKDVNPDIIVKFYNKFKHEDQINASAKIKRAYYDAFEGFNLSKLTAIAKKCPALMEDISEFAENKVADKKFKNNELVAQSQKKKKRAVELTKGEKYLNQMQAKETKMLSIKAARLELAELAASKTPDYKKIGDHLSSHIEIFQECVDWYPKDINLVHKAMTMLYSLPLYSGGSRNNQPTGTSIDYNASLDYLKVMLRKSPESRKALHDFIDIAKKYANSLSVPENILHITWMGKQIPGIASLRSMGNKLVALTLESVDIRQLLLNPAYENIHAVFLKADDKFLLKLAKQSNGDSQFLISMISKLNEQDKIKFFSEHKRTTLRLVSKLPVNDICLVLSANEKLRTVFSRWRFTASINRSPGVVRNILLNADSAHLSLLARMNNGFLKAALHRFPALVEERFELKIFQDNGIIPTANDVYATPDTYRNIFEKQSQNAKYLLFHADKELLSKLVKLCGKLINEFLNNNPDFKLTGERKQLCEYKEKKSALNQTPRYTQGRTSKDIINSLENASSVKLDGDKWNTIKKDQHLSKNDISNAIDLLTLKNSVLHRGSDIELTTKTKPIQIKKAKKRWARMIKMWEKEREGKEHDTNLTGKKTEFII